MELAFELIAGKTLHFTPHHKFKMYLKQNDVLIEKSVGEDCFDYNGTLFPDTPVAATGRKALHTYEPDLTAYQGKPGKPVEVSVSPQSPQEPAWEGLSLWLDNNAILSQGELQTYYTLRAIIDGRAHPVSLLTPLHKVNWEGQGTFCIHLENLKALLH